MTDSNYATHVDNRKSVSGLGGSISWNSKKQPTVNLSSCRAEYIARSVNCAQEIRCVQQVTTEVLGVEKEAVLQSSFLIILMWGQGPSVSMSAGTVF